VALQVSLMEAGKQKYFSMENPDSAQATQDPEVSLEETLVVRDAESQGQGGE
jgi:hypothetical protein